MKGAHRTLDTGRSPRCKCIYCNPDDGGDVQSVISNELRRVRARVLAQIDGDDLLESDEDVVADGDAEVQPEPEVGAGAEVVVAGTATAAVPASDQGGPHGGDGN
jgi:hypothetical protein